MRAVVAATLSAPPTCRTFCSGCGGLPASPAPQLRHVVSGGGHAASAGSFTVASVPLYLV
ncbi:hypothetical protein PC116_g10237 [Phytophthora cactorum]|uniref:Uncharacterized protein n=1 Tax=Phytophthora cactorum TaxID=29920 RepID=A0A8T1DYI3_9STRA|nr:hypothetical protein Pcac1_g18553 [Phytophthora cactorum]KAG2916580.1 hypothetical protein PC114_g7445 [Phytophthora cactorum]KAG2946791.1 hypothetical protein PC117_g7349 [Phytophthora cactorum]KAG3013561.1 hypothetical protein PC120_g13230 [Phytophthora cactorum]KAG3027886.1 hypothetical protein PC119_g7215 [Phytophthora cactorum]